MYPLMIDWLSPCPTCDKTNNAPNSCVVYTEKGNKNWLYAGDEVVCMRCGGKGEIGCIDYNVVDAIWYEDE